jgi:hypothetical protein
VRPEGYQEASPSPVYGAALLMRFGLLVHPGFKSPSLRTTSTLSGDLLTGEGVFDLVVSFGSPKGRADEGTRVADLGEATWVYRSVVVTRVAQDLLDDADALLD